MREERRRVQRTRVDEGVGIRLLDSPATMMLVDVSELGFSVVSVEPIAGTAPRWFRFFARTDGWFAELSARPVYVKPAREGYRTGFEFESVDRGDVHTAVETLLRHASPGSPAQSATP